MRVERTIDIEASPEAVWAVMVDVERWPDWTASMTRVERLDQGPFGPGCVVRITQPRVPAFQWRVTQFDAGRSFTWEARSLGGHTVASHFVEPLGGGRTRVRLVVNSTGWFVRLIAGRLQRLTEEYMDLEAQGLKRRCEAR